MIKKFMRMKFNREQQTNGKESGTLQILLTPTPKFIKAQGI